jgi:large subunit ribosomal protein L30
VAKQLRITQVRSAIGRDRTQKGTVRALGLRRLHHTVVHQDTPVIRGMIHKIKHLLDVVEVEGGK